MLNLLLSHFIGCILLLLAVFVLVYYSPVAPFPTKEETGPIELQTLKKERQLAHKRLKSHNNLKTNLRETY